MGIYFNPDNEKMRLDINTEYYVDKSELILHTNKLIATPKRYMCISRPRRFGKSTAANMLAAYYSRGCDSKDLFEKLKIAQNECFEKNLNKYNVIFLNMQEFLSRTRSMADMLAMIKKRILWELLDEYPDLKYFDNFDFISTMQDIYYYTKIPFVLIIDEWDCIFREYKDKLDEQGMYLDFLRDWLKDKAYIHLAYMTGILPIKKYGTHSALNMFDEYSMTNPRQLAEFVGFTESETKALCQIAGMDIALLKEWYDGYHFKESGPIYSPRSVIAAISSGICDDYWNQTETFEALRIYIDMNFDGLRDDIILMMAGEHVYINTGSFSNDMTTFNVKDDVLTLLIHLGYLGYNFENKYVYIPNTEVLKEYVNVVTVSDWGEVTKALRESANTLQAVWAQNEQKTAESIERAHIETSQLQYNDENALSYTISLAFYVARNYYTLHRELPSGKGFADIVFVPRRQFADKPAMIVELKWNRSAKGAIDQIKNKEYIQSLEAYKGNLLLVGINYDKKSKKHSCKIEKCEK